MPRFYFHIRNDCAVDDEEGQDLPDLAAATDLAYDFARDLVCVSIKENGNVNLDHFIEVADESGAMARRVTFRDAFTITG